MHTDADSMARNLKEFAEDFLGLDYRKFDVNQHPEIARAASTVLYNVLIAMGYNAYAAKILIGILGDDCFPILKMLADFLLKEGLQPSGKYGTAENNTLRGLIMLMYIWYINPELRDKDFFKYVLPDLYGDDIVAAIKKQVIDIFNNLTYARDCKKYLNMDCTSCEKDKPIVKTMKWDEIIFLKSRFIFRDKWNRYVTPLEMSSLTKTLEWYIPSPAITVAAQAIASMASCLWELFFHCEDEIQYDKTRSQFIAWIEEYYEVPERLIAFPTYEEILVKLGFEEEIQHEYKMMEQPWCGDNPYFFVLNQEGAVLDNKQ